MGPGDYALLELVERLGGVKGRKRLQKLVFIAKLEGLPLEDSFSFHYYGPYSSGLASRVDQLVETDFLREDARGVAMVGGVEYAYELTEKGNEFLQDVGPSAPDDFCEALECGLSRAVALKDRDVFELELASTLLYWLEKGYLWEDAVKTTEQRKKAHRDSNAFKEAREIATEVWSSRERSGD